MSHGLYRASKMGIQLKMIMTSMLMAKSLRIPKSCTTDSQEPGDVQKSDNKRSKEDGALISEPAREGLDYGASALVRVVDTELEHVEQACVLFHAIWTSPVAICLLIGFLVSNLGYSAMTGSGFMLASVPLLIFVSRILQRKRSIINTITKRRLATIAEVFAKSDLVKMMTLESHYLDKVSRLRYQEFRELRRLLNLHGGTNAYIIVSIIIHA